jgi:hypothetical protein
MSNLIYRLMQLKMDLCGSNFLSARDADRYYLHHFFYNAFQALKFNDISGDYAEFGVSGGNTFALANRERARTGLNMTLWAFDSFSGLPPGAGQNDEHPKWQKGAMSTSLEKFHRLCGKRGIAPDSYQCVPGYYSETLDKDPSRKTPADIALAYIDCDLYSSTISVFNFLSKRMKHGMIVAFDDYFCWSSTQISGERKALLEFQANNPQWYFLPFIQYGWGGMSFVVEKTEKNL